MASFVGVLLCWAVAGDWLGRRRISAPMVMVLGGMMLGLGGYAMALTGRYDETLDLQILVTVFGGPTPQRIAELILSVLLFVDSFAIRRGVLGHEPRLASRLLLLALPLSMAMAFALGLVLFGVGSWVIVLLLVCLVVPTDLAPAANIVKDERIPERVRDALNVESGYNDGLIAPVFVFALTLAGATSHASTPESALREAVPASLIAVGVGAGVGLVAGWLMRAAVTRQLSSSHAVRFGVVGVPLLTFALAGEAHGNGFVAAFVAGIAFRAARGEVAHKEVVLAEEVATLASYVMWFILGACSVIVLVALTSWQTWVFGIAALTIVRIVPVLLALLGSSLSTPDRWLVAALGPRGVATIVFAMLAFNDVPDENAQGLILSTMVLTVVGSLLLHGVGAAYLAERHGRRAVRQ